jgi:Transposase IS66 family
VERAEAEAIYDLGRGRCVEVILELAGAVERLSAETVLLEERVRRLEERSRQSSRTGSRPLSGDAPRMRQQRRAEARAKAEELLAGDAKKWSAGGQAGHEGAGRSLAPEDHVEEFVEHYPESCRGCGRVFGEAEKVPPRRPGRRQVAELPPVTVLITEHRSHRLRCPCCHTQTTAEFPAAVAGSRFGPRLQAAVVTLTARNQDRLTELLGERFAGICCSDRWWAYNHINPESRQACWSHLQRDVRFHSEGLPTQKQFGEQALALTSRLFHAWHHYRDHQDRGRLQHDTAPIKTELRTLLEQAGRKTPKNTYHRRFANNLLKIWPALWTFVTHPDVEPTNNAAERSLRGPVIHRKLSQGTRSQNGERFTEHAPSASVTCRLQHRSLFSYLTDLLTAHARGDPLPTLT